MFAVRIKIDLLFARECSLSRPASLDLGVIYKTILNETFYRFINVKPNPSGCSVSAQDHLNNRRRFTFTVDPRLASQTTLSLLWVSKREPAAGLGKRHVRDGF